MRVTRGDVGPGTVDPGYPAPISNWGWDREFVVVHYKSLVPVTDAVRGFMDDQFRAMQALYLGSRIDVRRGSTQDLSQDTDLADLLALDVGPCLLGQPTQEHDELFVHRDGAGADDLVIYIVQSLVNGTANTNLLGCATHPNGQPGAAVVRTGAAWLLAHECGHVLGLRHVPNKPDSNKDRLMYPNVGWTNPPPDVVAAETTTMLSSTLSRPATF